MKALGRFLYATLCIVFTIWGAVLVLGWLLFPKDNAEFIVGAIFFFGSLILDLLHSIRSRLDILIGQNAERGMSPPAKSPQITSDNWRNDSFDPQRAAFGNSAGARKRS